MEFYFDNNKFNRVIGILWLFTAVLNTYLLVRMIAYQLGFTLLAVPLILAIPLMYYHAYYYFTIHKKAYVKIVEDRLLIAKSTVFKPKSIVFREIKVMLKTKGKIGLGTKRGKIHTIHLKLLPKLQQETLLQSLEQYLHVAKQF